VKFLAKFISELSARKLSLKGSINIKFKRVSLLRHKTKRGSCIRVRDTLSLSLSLSLSHCYLVSHSLACQL
jgi:hypothetical protein